jgi:hypothetical protein
MILSEPVVGGSTSELAFLAAGRCRGRRAMTIRPPTNSAQSYRQKLADAFPDDPEIKQYLAANYSTEILEKAFEVLSKRIESREISNNMLVRIVLSLSKSTASLELERPPKRRRS